MKFVPATQLSCLALLLAMLLSANCQASTEDDTAMNAVMAKLGSSFTAGDFGYAVEVMYTPMLDAMGGKSAALASSQAVVAQMKVQNIRLVYWKAKPPYQYVSGTSRRYVLIPTETAVEIGGKKLKISSYQLGIKESNSAWQFVTGDSLTPELYSRFFPDFPKTVTLPKVEKSSE